MIEQEIHTPAPSTSGTGGRDRRLVRALVAGLGVFIALVLLRLITGETDITSSGTAGAALALAVPIGMAALGGLWSERSGVVNIGLEGMMIFGTWGAAFASYFSGNPWLGLLGGVVAGALGGLLHAITTVSFGVDHIVSGVAITILAPGVTRYLSDLLFTNETGGGATQSPPLPSFPTWSVPGIDGPLKSVEKHHWILLSDLAGLVRGLLTNLSPVTLLGVLLVPFSYYVLWRTAFGLRLRSCGENPTAAESLGVKVYPLKYAAVIISGAFAGVGGTFLAMVASSNYQEGQVNGRGYIGLAAMIFGNWRPGMVAGGAGLFGFTDALQLRGGADAVHAMLLLMGIALLALAAWHGYRRRIMTSVISAVVGAGLLVWFFTTSELPQEIVTYSPHITTLLVLGFAAQRLRMPAADGLRYRKGEGH
jgi:simple sugar transport system permease protein